MVPKFQPSIHKSVDKFGYSFAFDAPTVWNALPDEICAPPSLPSFRKQLKTPLVFSVVLDFFLSLDTENG